MRNFRSKSQYYHRKTEGIQKSKREEEQQQKQQQQHSRSFDVRAKEGKQIYFGNLHRNSENYGSKSENIEQQRNIRSADNNGTSTPARNTTKSRTYTYSRPNSDINKSAKDKKQEIKWIGVHHSSSSSPETKNAFPMRSNKPTEQSLIKFIIKQHRQKHETEQIGTKTVKKKEPILFMNEGYVCRGASHKLKPRLTWFAHKKEREKEKGIERMGIKMGMGLRSS